MSDETEQTTTETEEQQAAQFDNLEAEGTAPTVADDDKMDLILEIPVELSVEIGQTNMSIRNLLQLNQGSIVELDRLAGEALDVKVNGTLVAHGEVVVVKDRFGIRLTDVVSPAERLHKVSE